MPNHLQSKTIAGLVLILGIAIGLDIAGLLSQQAVEILKWTGASFMAVRAVANMPGGGQ